MMRRGGIFKTWKTHCMEEALLQIRTEALRLVHDVGATEKGNSRNFLQSSERSQYDRVRSNIIEYMVAKFVI